MNFKAWLLTESHYETTPELIAKQKQDWHSPFPGGPTYSDVQLIPVAEIQPNWGDYYPDKVKEYQQLLDNQTPFPPILLAKRYPHEKKYRIRDGTHRHLASLKNHLTHILALIGG